MREGFAGFARGECRRGLESLVPWPGPFAALYLSCCFLLEGLKRSNVLSICRLRLSDAATGIERLITVVRDRLHFVGTDAARVFQYRPFVELQQPIHILPPVIKSQVLALFHSQFGLLQKDDHEPIESVDFIGGEVILRDNDR